MLAILVSIKNKLTFNDLRLISSIFSVFGIKLYSTDTNISKKVLVGICKSIAIAIYGLAIVNHLTIAYTLMQTKSSDRVKNFLPVFLSYLLSILMWYLTHRSKKDFAALIVTVQHLRSIFKIKSHTSLIMNYTIMAIFMHFTFCIKSLNPHDKENFEIWLSNHLFSFSVEHNDFTFYSTCLLYFLNIMFSVTFPFCLIILYITVCQQLQLVLSAHTKRNLHQLSSYEITPLILSKCFKRYNCILSILHEFERNMSFLIFVAFTHAFIIFTLFSFLTKRDTLDNNKLDDPFIYLAMQSFVNLTAILFFASGVHEADILARDANDKILQRLSSENILELDKKITFLNVNNKPAFSLTGWKFFSITRNFFFTSTGCILTYTLLIVNL